MIRLCNFCLSKLNELDATILPKEDDEEPRTFVVAIERLYPFFDSVSQTQKLSVDLLADDDVMQEDIDAVDQYSCRNCHRVISNNVQCYVFRGREIDKQEEDDIPDGVVMVVTVGRFSRFDIPSVDDVRAAVSEMVEFSVPGGEGKVQDPTRAFEW